MIDDAKPINWRVNIIQCILRLNVLFISLSLSLSLLFDATIQYTLVRLRLSLNENDDVNVSLFSFERLSLSLSRPRRNLYTGDINNNLLIASFTKSAAIIKAENNQRFYGQQHFIIQNLYIAKPTENPSLWMINCIYQEYEYVVII